MALSGWEDVAEQGNEVILKHAGASLFGGTDVRGAPNLTGPRTRTRLLPGKLTLTNERLIFHSSWSASQDVRIETELSAIKAVNIIPIILWMKWLAIETDQEEEHWFRVKRTKEWQEEIQTAGTRVI